MTLRSVFLLACVSVLWLGCHRDYGLGSQPDATRRYQQVIPLGCPSPGHQTNQRAATEGGPLRSFVFRHHYLSLVLPLRLVARGRTSFTMKSFRSSQVRPCGRRQVPCG